MRAEMRPLGDLMRPSDGTVDPSKYPEEVFDLYSIPAYDRGDPDVIAGSEIGSAKQVVKPGDVLLSKIVPHIRRSWVVGESRGRRIIASGEWIVLRSPHLHPEYLRHLLVGDAFHASYMQTVSGVGGSLLRARPAHVAKIDVPIPSLKEQQRLARILTRADELRVKRQVALRMLDSLEYAAFVHWFGDACTEVDRWEMRTVGDVAAVLGGLQVSSARAALPVAVPYLRVANVHRGRLDTTEIKTMNVTDAELSRTVLHRGDLLVVEGHGNPEEIGRAAVWDGSIAPCVHQNHLIRVRCDSRVVLPEFACAFINSPGGRRHLLRSGKTTSGLNTISVSEVRATPIALPPVELQQRFASTIARIDRMRRQQAVAKDETDALYRALQHRVFHGEL